MPPLQGEAEPTRLHGLSRAGVVLSARGSSAQAGGAKAAKGDAAVMEVVMGLIVVLVFVLLLYGALR